MKKCNKCKKKKDYSEYSKKADTKDGYCRRCLDCSRQDCKDYYRKNINILLPIKNARLKEKRIINKKFVFEYLLNHSCIDCGESDPMVLDFDHQRDKLQNVSLMMQRGVLLDKLKAEIAKCEVRCANCHRRKTAKEQNWYREILEGVDYEALSACKKFS